MDQRTYERLKREFESERQARIEAAHSEYQMNIESLERIWSRLHGGQPQAVQAAPTAPAVRVKSPTRGRTTGIRSAIRIAVAGIEGDFTPDPIFDKLQADFPGLKRQMVTDALSRMANDDEFEVVTPGRGRRPAVYRVPKTAEENRTEHVNNAGIGQTEGLPM